MNEVGVRLRDHNLVECNSTNMKSGGKHGTINSPRHAHVLKACIYFLFMTIHNTVSLFWGKHQKLQMAELLKSCIMYSNINRNTYWWVVAWISEILNKGKAWSSWKTAEYKLSSPEPSKMAANRTSDNFGSIKTPFIAVCPWISINWYD